MNIHSKDCSEILPFNNNMSIGDAKQIYYSTNYSTKITQEEYRFKYIMTSYALGRIFEKMEQRYDDDNEIENSDLKQGKGNLIGGIRAHVASNVI